MTYFVKICIAESCQIFYFTVQPFHTFKKQNYQHVRARAPGPNAAENGSGAAIRAPGPGGGSLKEEHPKGSQKSLQHAQVPKGTVADLEAWKWKSEFL